MTDRSDSGSEIVATITAGAALVVTDVHCRHTGAPRTFVNVQFSHNVPLRPGIDLHIFGSVRSGRTLQTNDALEADMVAEMAKIAGLSLPQVDFSLFSVPASWVMEGGVVLPEPGEEAQWLEEHRRAAE